MAIGPSVFRQVATIKSSATGRRHWRREVEGRNWRKTNKQKNQENKTENKCRETNPADCTAETHARPQTETKTNSTKVPSVWEMEERKAEAEADADGGSREPARRVRVSKLYGPVRFQQLFHRLGEQARKRHSQNSQTSQRESRSEEREQKRRNKNESVPGTSRFAGLENEV